MDSERLLEVGRRIRYLRQSRRLTLQALSEQCGLSVGFLSQIERGLSSFSVPSLRSICRALNVSLAEVLVMSNGPGKAFFADPRPAAIVKSDGRPFVSLSNESIKYRFLGEGFPNKRFEAVIGEMEGGSQNGSHIHEGEEFGYVLSGRIRFVTGEDEQELGPGDSYHLMASTPHACVALETGAKILWIQTARYVKALSLLGSDAHDVAIPPATPSASPPVAVGDGIPHVNLSQQAARYRFLSGRLAEGQLEVYLVELPSGSEQTLHSDGDEEFAYILEGRIRLEIENETYTLGVGDSFHLPATTAHTYRGGGDEDTKILWVQMRIAPSVVEEMWTESNGGAPAPDDQPTKDG